MQQPYVPQSRHSADPTFDCPQQAPGLWSYREQSLQDPAFVHLPDNDGFYGGGATASDARAMTTGCSNCNEQAMTISSLNGELNQAKAYIKELEARLAESRGALQQVGGRSQVLAAKVPVDFSQDVSMSSVSTTATSIASTAYRSIPTVTGDIGCNKKDKRMDCHVPELIRCAAKGEEEMVSNLLDSGEAVNCTDDMGLTALHCAAKKGHARVVDLLLARMADPNSCCTAWRGETPLHYACKYGHKEVVELLLASGAQPDVKSHKSMTPVQYAKEKGFESIEAVLRLAIRDRSADPPYPSSLCH